MSLNEAKRLYNQGQQKLAAGDLEGAIAKFQQALQFHPTDDTYVGLGKSLQKLEKHQEAIKHYQKAIEIDSSCYWAHNGIGDAFSDLEQYEKALNAHEKAIQINSNLPDAHCGIGWAFYNLKQYEKALEAYTEAIRINPNFPRASNGVGNIWWKLGKYEEAIKYYQRTIEIAPSYYAAHLNLGQTFLDSSQYEKALESYRVAIKVNPESPYACIGLGNAFLALEQYEKALEACQEAARINPDLSDAHYSLGNILCELKEYEKAVEAYKQAIKISPSGQYAQHAYKGLESIFLSSGQHEKAIEAYEELAKVNPGFPHAYCCRGNALWRLGKYEEAMVSYQQAIKRDLSYYPAHCGRGDALWRLERNEEAINSYQKTIKIEPNYYWAHNGIGNAFQALEQYEKAFTSYGEAIRINPDLPHAYSGQGDALWKLARYEEAIDSYQRVMEIEPHYYDAHNGLGNVLFDCGQYEKAVKAYREAIRVNPNLFHAHNGLGNTLWKLEQYSEASVSYRKSIEIQPNYYAYNGLGNVLCNLRDFGEATVNYNKAIAIHPEYYNPWHQKGWVIWQSRGFQQAIIFCDDSILKLRNKGAEFREVLGYLYLRKGEVFHQAGRFQYNRFTYFLNKSVNSYQAAIKIFEQISAKEPYLEALQNVVQVLLLLNRVEEADELLRKGTDYLHRWLDETSSPTQRKNLALKFAGFNQLTVDRHIQAVSQLEDESAIQAKLKDALATAEKGKNTCLFWLLYVLGDAVTSPSFAEVQQLLSPGTAIAYWHLSPAALTTFVLKPGESAPMLITAPSTTERPASLQQLLKLEAWMKEWDDQYSDYRNKGKDQRDAEHSWRKDMAQRLFERQEEPGNLKEILQIEAIAQHLNGINHLILIPHRDLHRFPLHALFDTRFTVSYLPSIQVGIQLQQQQPSGGDRLLSIENPASPDQASLGFARI